MNTFYHGDCLFVMDHDIEPESVDLIYLDPPFFTGKIQKGKKWRPEAMGISFEDSKEYWGKQQAGMHKNAPLWMNEIPRSDEFKAYLWYMLKRLELCKRVLKPTGSIYLHCDWHASHYLKMVMDKIFGEDNFKNEIIWNYRRWTNATKNYSKMHDILLYYTKSKVYSFNKQTTTITPTQYQEQAQKRGFASNTIKGKRQIIIFDQSKVEGIDLSKYDIVTHKSTKDCVTYANDVWADIDYIPSGSKERIGYPTQKPKALLNRIIEASSNKGDVVLDPFCGCGTTIAVAQQLNRQWIGIDISKDAYKISHKRESQLSLGENKEAQYISRDLTEVMAMDWKPFEMWGNQYYRATKPYPDKEVDGITKDGVPIQVKAHKTKIDSTDIHKFNSGIENHPALQIVKPKTAYFLSQSGFTNSTRELVSKLKDTGKITIELKEPKDLLPPNTTEMEDNNG